MVLALALAARAFLRSESAAPFLLITAGLCAVGWLLGSVPQEETLAAVFKGALRFAFSAAIGLMVAGAIPGVSRWLVRSQGAVELGLAGDIVLEAVHTPGLRIALSLVLAFRATQVLGNSEQRKWVETVSWPSTSLLIWCLLAPWELQRLWGFHWTWRLLLVVAGGVLCGLVLLLLMIGPNRDEEMRLRWPVPLAWKAVALVLVDLSYWVVAMTHPAWFGSLY